MDFGKCSKSAKEDCICCPLFSSLCFSSLRCSFLAYFERLWQRTTQLQSLNSSCKWASNCFGDQITIKSTKTYTIWLETIAKVVNMLIELKGNNYYSKVFKRINYRLSNNTFWVVITPPNRHIASLLAIKERKKN